MTLIRDPWHGSLNKLSRYIREFGKWGDHYPDGKDMPISDFLSLSDFSYQYNPPYLYAQQAVCNEFVVNAYKKYEVLKSISDWIREQNEFLQILKDIDGTFFRLTLSLNQLWQWELLSDDSIGKQLEDEDADSIKLCDRFSPSDAYTSQSNNIFCFRLLCKEKKYSFAVRYGDLNLYTEKPDRKLQFLRTQEADKFIRLCSVLINALNEKSMEFERGGNSN